MHKFYSMDKPIKVLNNKAELLRMIDTQKALGDNYHALYRANVNALISDFELSFIDVNSQRRAIAAAIWRNNNIGIVRQSYRRAAWLKAFIMKLCSIRSRITIAAIIDKVNTLENGA